MRKKEQAVAALLNPAQCLEAAKVIGSGSNTLLRWMNLKTAVESRQMSLLPPARACSDGLYHPSG
jgi:hypothetical protein